MAYQAFGFATGATASIGPGRAKARFTATEWSVIHIARRDGLASVRPAARIRRVACRLLGIDPVNRLADPRLEALRQAAVLAWAERGAVDQASIVALGAHGFAFDQVALLAAHVAAESRSDRPRG